MPDPLLRRRLDQHLEQLPLLPSVVTALMSLDRRSDEYFEQVLKLVESEPNFSARILSAANSAASGSRMPITTLRAAISRTGSHQASGLVLGLAVTRVFVPKDAWEKSLWRHAIQVATASRELARRSPEIRVDPDEAYAAGLLHDVGRFVLFQEAPEELRRVDESGWDSPDGLLAAERAICGLTHAELGATACSKWAIPELITLSVLHHHAPELAELDLEVARLVALVHVADMVMFPSAMPGSPSLDQADDETLRIRVLEKLPSSLRMDTVGLRDLLRSSSAEAEEMFASLKLH